MQEPVLLVVKESIPTTILKKKKTEKIKKTKNAQELFCTPIQKRKNENTTSNEPEDCQTTAATNKAAQPRKQQKNKSI